MTLFDKALNRILTNYSKKYNCIPFYGVLPKFSYYLPGITQNTYYCVTANPKSAKTQLSDFLFLYHPYNFYKNNPKSDIKLRIFYNSLEMDLESKIIQGISKLLYEQYGLRYSSQDILSYKAKRLPDDIIQKIKSLRSYFEELEDIVVMTDAQQSPTEISRKIISYAENNGKTFYKDVKHRIIGEDSDTIAKEFKYYTPNNPNEYVIILNDHLAELSTHENKDIKQTIETHTDNMRIIRNRYRYIPVDIQQQASSKQDLSHFKADKMEPSGEGLGETKLTQRKVNVMLGLFKPSLHEIKNYRGYDITRLQDKYLNLSLILNRNGESNINVGLYFDGAVNYFEELPKSSEFSENESLYEKYENGLVGPHDTEKQLKIKI